MAGRANVNWVKGEPLHKNIKGSHILSISSNGSPQTIPSSGVLEIPGVAKLEQNVVTTTKRGISVTALRITVLGGTQVGSVINLGHAKVSFTRAF